MQLSSEQKSLCEAKAIVSLWQGINWFGKVTM